MERRAGIALGILLACCPCAPALGRSLDINQYAHKAWTIRDGFFDSPIHAIAQTPDGYLWLGTELGLLHFDGIRAVPWQPPTGERLPSPIVTKLLVVRDGRLWIGTAAGLATRKDDRLIHYPELAGQIVAALLEDRGGTVWAGTIGFPTGRLCAIRGGAIQCFGQDGSLGRMLLSLLEENGNLWAGAETGLWRWKPGPPKRYAMPMQELKDLNKVDDGPLLIAMRGGLRQLVGQKAAAYPIEAARLPVNPTRLLRDRNGGLWIGTIDRGLLHIHQGRTDLFSRSDGLSGDIVLSLFEDREGNIWVSTTEGLDRFRALAVPTISAKQGLAGDDVLSVLAARDGTVWLSTRGGLNRWNNGQITSYRKRDGLLDDSADSLFEDDRGRIWVSTFRGIAWLEDGRFVPLRSVSSRIVHNMVEGPTGSFWINDQEQGLIHLLGEKVVDRIPWLALGHKDHATALVRDPTRGGLWLGFFNGGVIFFKDGQIRASYATAEGLRPGRVSNLQLHSDGSLWAATAAGVSRIKDNHVATLNTRNGLPCDTVHWTMEDDDHSIWLYMPCGLARISRAELDAWAADPNRTVKATVFNSSDGVRSEASAGGYSPQAATLQDGRLWFATVRGVGVIDPHHLSFNKLPPPVHIEQITADRRKHDATSNLHLPPLVRDLEIDYTALSLVAPEKIRFRVKLEGRDRDWRDVGNERKAFYNDLPPRNYCFRVAACNNSGVWNEAGASFDFSIAPAYYQTNWFRASIAAIFLAMLWGLHRLRLHQIAREFNANLEGRVDERLRVARELHDTLLQSFQGLLLQFQGARNLLRGRAEDAGQLLDYALDVAARAITEARDSVQDMRSSTVVTNDLARAIEALGEELAAHQRAANGDASAFAVEVEGGPKELHPILRDEVYRITGEALRNGFRHARARQIEVEIRYDARQFRVRVRDDGIGIDASVLSHEGRPGHWGLRGMRERAKGIGGQLEVWSDHGAGTEVELTIPASVAYGSHAKRRLHLFKSKMGTKS